MVILGKVRVSKLEQAQNSHALEQQKQRLVSAGCQEIIVSIESGSKSRKHLDLIYQRIEKGDITEIVVTRIDRIIRSLPKLREFIDYCIARNINVRILDQQIDLSTAHGKLMLNVLGSLAEWETDLLESRVRHGIKHQQNLGRAPGILPFGYRRSTDDKYELNTGEYKDSGQRVCDVAREIVDIFLRTQSAWRTTRILEEKYGVGTLGKGARSGKEFPRGVGIRAWLQNPILQGHTVYYWQKPNEKRLLDTHEAIVSASEVRELSKIFKITVKPPKKSVSDFLPLAGLVFCGCCGQKFKAHKGQKRKDGSYKIYWYCRMRTLPTKQCTSQGSITNEDLESAAITYLMSEASADRIASIAHSHQKGKASAESEDLAKARLALDQIAHLDDEYFGDTKKQILLRINQLELDQTQKFEERNEDLIELKAFASDPLFFDLVKTEGQLRRFFTRFQIRLVVAEDLVISVVSVFDA